MYLGAKKQLFSLFGVNYLCGSDDCILANKCSFYLSVIVDITEVAPTYIEAADLLILPLSKDEILELEYVHFLINEIFTPYFVQSVILRLSLRKQAPRP